MSREDLVDLDNPTWWISLSAGRSMGSDYVMLNRAQAEEYNKDPNAYAARHAGVSKHDYLDWLENGPFVRCLANTKSGKRCRHGDACMGGVKDWVEMQGNYFCFVHREGT